MVWHAVTMFANPSSLILILVNLLPVGGVLWFDWSVLEILLLYWTESVIIGAINVLRMLASQPDHMLAGFRGRRGRIPPVLAGNRDGEQSPSPRRGLKAFLVPFFIFHYGMFCYAHLTAVASIFSERGVNSNLLDVVPPFTDLMFWLVAASIFLSHLFSFLTNYLGKGEYRRTGLAALMQRPYGRIIVMHVTVIIGAAVVSWLGDHLAMLIVLVAVKTLMDLKLHHRERQLLATDTPTPTATVARGPVTSQQGTGADT